jgi:hypothetical protein
MPPKGARRGRGRARRAGLDLAVAGLGASTQTRRAKLFAEFEAFAASEGVSPAEFTELMDGGGVRPISDMLRRYGDRMYHAERPRSDYKDTILAVVDRRDDWRRLLAAPWRVVTRWHALEPTEHHVPCPVAVARAVVCAALLAECFDFAATVSVGFGGALRPIEFRKVRWGGVFFSPDAATAFVVISADTGVQPKNAGRGSCGHEQHARIDHPLIVPLLRWLKRRRSAGRSLWPGSEGDFSRQWKAWLGFLGVPSRQHEGYTPASLRAGAASAMYEAGADLDDIAWVLRHSNLQSLRSYIQELPAATRRVRLSARVEARVAQYSAALDAAVAERTAI